MFIVNQHNSRKTPDLIRINFDRPTKEINAAKCKLFTSTPSAKSVKRHKPENNVDNSTTLLDNKELLDNVEISTFAAQS